MKKSVILASIIALSSVSMATAADLGLDINLGGGVVLGGTSNFSNNDGSVKTKELKGGKSKAASEGYALTEGTFSGEFKSRGTGGDTHSLLNLEGKLSSQAGSLASTGLSSSGNGSGSAHADNSASTGGITGGVGLSGAGGLKY